MSIDTLRKYQIAVLTTLSLLAAFAHPVNAAPITIEANVETKEQIRLDFVDGSKHFVVMVRREGAATGSGPFDGASVSEYGRHDIIPGIGGDPSGYLVFAQGEGNVAYVKYMVRAVYVPSADGKLAVLDNGVWELVGGTGRYKDLRGAGMMRIRQLSTKDRKFVLNGDLVPAQ
jgi:hypothetical protein